MGKAKTRSAAVLIDNLEVCRRLGVEYDTWRKRVKRGDAPLPMTVQGRRGYYRLSDVKQYEETGQWPKGVVFNTPALGQTPPSPLSAETSEREHTHAESATGWRDRGNG